MQEFDIQLIDVDNIFQNYLTNNSIKVQIFIDEQKIQEFDLTDYMKKQDKKIKLNLDINQNQSIYLYFFPARNINFEFDTIEIQSNNIVNKDSSSKWYRIKVNDTNPLDNKQEDLYFMINVKFQKHHQNQNYDIQKLQQKLQQPSFEASDIMDQIQIEDVLRDLMHQIDECAEKSMLSSQHRSKTAQMEAAFNEMVDFSDDNGKKLQSKQTQQFKQMEQKLRLKQFTHLNKRIQEFKLILQPQLANIQIDPESIKQKKTPIVKINDGNIVENNQKLVKYNLTYRISSYLFEQLIFFLILLRLIQPDQIFVIFQNILNIIRINNSQELQNIFNIFVNINVFINHILYFTSRITLLQTQKIVLIKLNTIIINYYQNSPVSKQIQDLDNKMKQNPQQELLILSDLCSQILMYFDDNDEQKFIQEAENYDLNTPITIKIKKQLLQMVQKWKYNKIKQPQQELVQEQRQAQDQKPNYVRDQVSDFVKTNQQEQKEMSNSQKLYEQRVAQRKQNKLQYDLPYKRGIQSKAYNYTPLKLDYQEEMKSQRLSTELSPYKSRIQEMQEYQKSQYSIDRRINKEEKSVEQNQVYDQYRQNKLNSMQEVRGKEYLLLDKKSPLVNDKTEKNEIYTARPTQDPFFRQFDHNSPLRKTQSNQYIPPSLRNDLTNSPLNKYTQRSSQFKK